MISTSKLSRLENAQGKPQPRDIKDLILYYGIQDAPLAASLRRWAAAAQRPGWWTDFDDNVLGGGLDAHLAYETDATVERTYALPFVPDLLQTTEYARAIFRHMEHRSEAEIDPLLAILLRRQEALRSREHLEPLQLIAVTHESALRQAVGSSWILRNQLDALVERSSVPNVSLHVLPFAASPVFTMTCMYAHFDYEDYVEGGVVHIETHAGFWSVDDPATVERYRTAHDALVRASLNEDDSRELILSVRKSLPDGT